MYFITDVINESDCSFHCNFDPQLSVLNLHWNLSAKVEDLIDYGLITGFHVTMERLGGDNEIMTYHMNNESLTSNMSFEPNQWYMLIGRVLSEGNKIYVPQLFYTYFKTPEAAIGKTMQLLAMYDYNCSYILLFVFTNLNLMNL